LLHDTFGIPAKRALDQPRDSGYDIDYRPFAIEVKRRRRIGNLYEWLGQCDVPVKHPDAKRTPTLMLRADGKGWLVVMRFEDWAALAREEIADA
jgi:hypothetical protein